MYFELPKFIEKIKTSLEVLPTFRGGLVVVLIASKSSKLLRNLQLCSSLFTSGSAFISNRTHQLGKAGSPNLNFAGGCATEQLGCLNNRSEGSPPQNNTQNHIK